jgi:SpoVK/Ycf46/Vps4 family AAA+-type ATPase
VAGESGATFFSISAAALVSKHLGEGEKLVRALFRIARERAPAIIFVDEIDSIMTRRNSEEHEASRRLKTEFLIQMDGLSSNVGGGDPPTRVLLLAATNLPEELDDALIRRLTRRIYIGPPDAVSRHALLTSLLSTGLAHTIRGAHMNELVSITEGYSNSDLTALCGDAAFGPIRGIAPSVLLTMAKEHLPPVTMEHFRASIRTVRPSVSKERLKSYEVWAKKQESAR